MEFSNLIQDKKNTKIKQTIYYTLEQVEGKIKKINGNDFLVVKDHYSYKAYLPSSAEKNKYAHSISIGFSSKRLKDLPDAITKTIKSLVKNYGSKDGFCESSFYEYAEKQAFRTEQAGKC